MLTFRFTPSRLVCLVLVTISTLIFLYNHGPLKESMHTIIFVRSVQIKNRALSFFNAIPQKDDSFTYDGDYIFHNNRLRLWNEGKCLDSTDGKTLTAQFCDPDVKQVRFFRSP
jgi:hypothetical protein